MQVYKKIYSNPRPRDAQQQKVHWYRKEAVIHQSNCQVFWYVKW